MLSFSALSEQPLSASVAVADANAFLTTGAEGTTSAGSIGVAAETTLTGVSGSGVTNSVSISLAKEVTAVPASLETGDVTVTLSEVLTGVSATTVAADSFNSTTILLDAAITVSGTEATTSSGVAGFDAKANVTLDAATADADLTINSFEDEDAQATITIGSVTASTAANWDTVNGIYAVQVVFTATDFERKRCVNIVPYGNYKVYVTR